MSFIAVLALAGCGKSEAPASVTAPAAPPLESLDAVAEDKTATLIENADGSTRVVTGETAAEPDRKDDETPPKNPE